VGDQDDPIHELNPASPLAHMRGRVACEVNVGGVAGALQRLLGTKMSQFSLGAESVSATVEPVASLVPAGGLVASTTSAFGRRVRAAGAYVAGSAWVTCGGGRQADDDVGLGRVRRRAAVGEPDPSNSPKTAQGITSPETRSLISRLTEAIDRLNDEVTERPRHVLEVLAIFDRCRNSFAAIMSLLNNGFSHEAMPPPCPHTGNLADRRQVAEGCRLAPEAAVRRRTRAWSLLRRSGSEREKPADCCSSGHENAFWKVLAGSVTKVW
jgi:hypothetical protein